MKRITPLFILYSGLAFFSVLLGAGNIIFPLQIGALSGNKAFISIAGFFISGILLPFLGLIAATLFDGNYKAFFFRVGKFPGWLLMLFCIACLGPGIAIPRLVTLSYEMALPLFPQLPFIPFTLSFLSIIFLIGNHKNNIIKILGFYFAPLLLITMSLFIGKGFITPHLATALIPPAKPILTTLWDAIKLGYNTLDMLAAIFMASFFMKMLKNKLNITSSEELKKIERIGFLCSAIGISLLALITLGLCLVGVWYGNGITTLSTAEYFSHIVNKIFGTKSSFMILFTILLACISTMIGLAAISAHFLQNTIMKNKINYTSSLMIILMLSFIPCTFGLENILTHSEPIINVAYPTMIVLTICNILYKLYEFPHVKLPTFIVFSSVILHYLQRFFI